MSGKLLINESPMQVLPLFAKAIGMNEAIFAQQLKFLLNRSRNFRDGEYWVYNSYDNWHEIFPFWSVSTIKRIVKSLENQEIIVTSSEYNRSPVDKTKWYRLNMGTINRINDEIVATDENSQPSYQNGLSTDQNGLSTDQNDTTNNQENLQQENLQQESNNPPNPPEGNGEQSKPEKSERKPKKPKATNYTDGFIRFWQAYITAPNGLTARNQGKAKAFEYWKRDGLESIADELVEKVKDFWTHDSLWHKGYQPYAQKWLNEKRYEDDPQPEINTVNDTRLTAKEAERLRAEAELDAWARGEYDGKDIYASRGNVIDGEVV